MGDGDFGREDGVPPAEGRCGVCGSDTHLTEEHPERRAMGATAVPHREKRCDICGSDTHTTGEHPG